MIRLKDEAGHWVHDIHIHIDLQSEIYDIDCNRDEVFAKLFDENDPVVKELVDDGFEIVE